jgi:hypothetical protein
MARELKEKVQVVGNNQNRTQNPPTRLGPAQPINQSMSVFSHFTLKYVQSFKKTMLGAVKIQSC